MSRFPKRSKYGAVRTTIDGVTFASKAEANYYADLRWQLRAGIIRDLELQPTFPIEVMNPANGEMVLCAVYRADFKHVDDRGRTVITDVKGMRTDVYRLKKRLVEGLYGIKIQEVK